LSTVPNPERAERRAAAIRAAKEEFESYSDSEKIELRARRDRADEAGRFVANYRWQATPANPAVG
jgi:hypothetical protein